MKRASVLVPLLISLIVALHAPQRAGAQDLAPEQILRRAEQSVYPDAFRMTATLETRESNQTVSSMVMDVIYKRGVGSRIELRDPPRSRGIRFLQKEEGLWLFNPRAGTGTAIRLSPRAAFQGSVFSNRDVGDPQYTTQYEVKLKGSETLEHPQLGAVSALVLEGTARSESAAYSRIELWVRARDFVLLRGEYYAKSGLLFKKILFTDLRQMAGIERPTVMRMTSMDQPDRESVLTITSLVQDPGMADARFSLAALTQ